MPQIDRWAAEASLAAVPEDKNAETRRGEKKNPVTWGTRDSTMVVVVGGHR